MYRLPSFHQLTLQSKFVNVLALEKSTQMYAYLLTLQDENAEQESKLEFDQQCLSCTRSGLFKLA